MSIQLVSTLDQPPSRLDNEAMYRRAGKRVRQWRKDHDDMTQLAFAKRAKVSVGCLQSFERGTRGTRDKNVVKIAHAMDLTPQQLLEDDDPIEKPNPLHKDLRTEDYRLAQQYHHAGADVKSAVKALLAPAVADDHREQLAMLIQQLLHLPQLPESVLADAIGLLQGLVTKLAAALAPPVPAPSQTDRKLKHS